MSVIRYRADLLFQAEQDAIENWHGWDECQTGASGFGYVAIDWVEFKIEDNLRKPFYQQLSFDRRFILVETNCASMPCDTTRNFSR